MTVVVHLWYTKRLTLWECEFFFVRASLDSTIELAIEGCPRRDVLVVCENIFFECRATIEMFVSESCIERRACKR